MSWGSLFGGSMGGLVNTAGNVSSSSGGWASALSGGSGGGWSSFFSGLGSMFGGGSGGNVWGQMLAGGLQGYASAEGQSILTTQQIQEKARQDRMSTAYEAQLVDYYKQRDKVRKRQALDTYGQFSTMNRWAPNATPPAPIDQPAAPQGGV